MVETPVKKFDLIMGINVRASFVLAHAVLPHMIKQKWGHIVMMSPPLEASALQRTTAPTPSPSSA